MTNLDRIREMTADELAAIIADGISSDACDYCEYNISYCDGAPCRGISEKEIIKKYLLRKVTE